MPRFAKLATAKNVGSGFEDQFKTGSVWRKLLATHPESLQAVKRASVEDARAMWTTHNNLDQWFSDAKKDLLPSGLYLDVPTLNVDGTLISELTERSPEVTQRIINMDETHHDLSITGDKSGSRAVTYHDPSLQRGPRRDVKSSRHVTGVYATTAAGEAVPPMYIFDSGAKNEANFRVKLGWVENLPVITGRFGCPTMIEQDSFFSVRSRGSMDDTLLNDYIERVIFPLYPNMAKVAEFDPVTGRLLKGPVLLTLDAGPGQIVASEEIILK
jgi:hypothetical protein